MSEFCSARRRFYACVRALFFLFLAIFMLVQLLVTSFTSVSKLGRAENGSTSAGDANTVVLSMVPQGLHKFLTTRPHNATSVNSTWEIQRQIERGAENGSTSAGDANTVVLSMVPQGLHKFLTTRPHNATSVNSTWEIQRQIERYNSMQTIHNEDLFGPLRNDSLVIIVQVHTRLRYLRHLIISLAQARDISSVLLIMSHDHWDEEVNDLVQSIDFCKVMQIFYPYSIQTHPDTFPGESANDCPRNMKKQRSSTRCNNAEHPDLYGHYREAKFTQTKHHWWWKANRVFNQLEVTRNFLGLVLFIEEDHFLAEDFLHTLNIMQSTVRMTCSQCNILSLGTYLKTYNYYADSKKLGRRHQLMGSGLNAPVWSFQVLPSMYQQYVKFHIGECGVHHKNNCESTAVISQVQKILQKASRYFYPDHLSVTYSAVKKKPLKKGNGGWGDVRDHELCMNITYYNMR
ncbi:alpha-1,6-mannosyl-glycoprotein 2-beta-N-acetylglucosaminyltransferase [Diaphorina citri]|uniref:Alpha-1,6-mannosyl-glycoprotein 2-beta-N-acetylglucosaminyltransferase n=1 Tax=Diaphorina citri TaxID=121845 RepID=A0A3Q0INR7_DIACI|nr:alpha-1,6-mannosyl-glycoprotein 2-beta-N-acetylglucosaminyltransferase [Diaphorina citri]